MVGRYLPRVIMPAASNKHFAVMSLMALLVMIMMTILMVTDHEINLKTCVHTAFDKIGCVHKKSIHCRMKGSLERIQICLSLGNKSIRRCFVPIGFPAGGRESLGKVRGGKGRERALAASKTNHPSPLNHPFLPHQLCCYPLSTKYPQPHQPPSATRPSTM